MALEEKVEKAMRETGFLMVSTRLQGEEVTSAATRRLCADNGLEESLDGLARMDQKNETKPKCPTKFAVSDVNSDRSLADDRFTGLFSSGAETLINSRAAF